MEYRDIFPTPIVAGTELRAQGKKERRDESVETGESPSASVRLRREERDVRLC